MAFEIPMPAGRFQIVPEFERVREARACLLMDSGLPARTPCPDQG
jgi:hypothetical protein